MKKISLFLACVLLFACLLPAAVACADATISSSKKQFCSYCGNQIPADSKFCMYCGKAVIYPSSGSSSSSSSSYSSWGPWSSWSTTPVSATETRQIETRTVTTGYNMVHYGTQEAVPPYYRVFRNFSVRKNMSAYGARESYGEKHFTRTVSAALLRNAQRYEPGACITGDYSGYQRGTTTAYYFGDDKYVWFIESEQQVREYRYRNLY